MKKDELSQLAKVEESHWWFKERRELLRLWAAKQSIRLRVLDVGAGVGRQAILLQDEFSWNVSAVEYSDFGSTACAEQGLHVIKADASELPIEDRAIQAVVAMDVLEHIVGDEKVLREFCRVLVPGGALFITVPAFTFLWSAHDEAVDHVRRYSKKELISKIENAGFKVNSIRYWNSLLFPLAVITRLAGQNGADLEIPSGFINRLCSVIVKMERNSKLTGRLPGTSLIVEAQKVHEADLKSI